MKKRKLWVLLVTALAVFLLAAVVLHFTAVPAVRHHASPGWLIYYAAWLVFAGWLLTQPEPSPDSSGQVRRLAIFAWPVWARFAWGILTAIALGRFVYALVG
jgi:hypothetical protein